jgi:hypothetical protein
MILSRYNQPDITKFILQVAIVTLLQGDHSTYYIIVEPE